MISELSKFFDAVSNKNELVYFIQSVIGGPIKIGVSKDIISRYKQLQTAHYNKLKIIGLYCGGYEEEKEFHRKFNEFKMNGEWYEPNIKLLDFIIRKSIFVDRSILINEQSIRTKKGLQKAASEGRYPGRPKVIIDHQKIKKWKDQGFSERASVKICGYSLSTYYRKKKEERR